MSTAVPTLPAMATKAPMEVPMMTAVCVTGVICESWVVGMGESSDDEAVAVFGVDAGVADST